MLPFKVPIVVAVRIGGVIVEFEAIAADVTHCVKVIFCIECVVQIQVNIIK